MHIAIRCDGNKEMGMGHIYRCMNLSRDLEPKGVKTVFFIRPFDDSIKKLAKNGFNFKVIADDKEFLECFVENRFEMVVFDTRNTNRENIQKIKEKGVKIISFDDTGSGSVYADLLIDANREQREIPHREGINRPVKCFGPQYILLKKQFHSFWKKEKTISETVKSIMISMGGSDPLNISRRMLKALKSEDRLNVKLVLGPAYHDKQTIEDANEVKHIELIKDTNSIEEFMYESDLIFCSGGITLYEAMAVGVPAIVISQNCHQFAIAEKFRKLGAVRHLGLGNRLPEESIIKAINTSEEERVFMSKKGKSIVDGRGIEKISEEILRMGCCYECAS